MKKAALLAAAGALLLPQPGWAENRFISTSSVAVTSGDYGTTEETTITQLSQSFKYRAEQGEIGLVIPYVFRDGTGATPGESGRSRRSAVPEDASGIGDLRLKGTYYWVEETDAQPAVDLTGQIKFPTADDDEGLGTGGFDVGFGPELTKQFGSLIAFGGLELLVRDTPSDSAVKSARLDYSAGLGYAFTERFTAYVSLEGGTKSSDNSDAPLEVVLSANHKASETVSVNGFVLAGLTDGSPEAGGGAGISIKF